MNTLSGWLEAVANSLSASINSLGTYLPDIGAAIAVVLIGWVLAKLIRGALTRSGSALNTAFGALGRPLSSTGLRVSRRLIALTANFSFWMVILLFAAIAARVAGLDAFSVWLDRVVDYLPTLLAGLLIAFAGYLLSGLVRDLVDATFVSVGSSTNTLVGLVAQGAVLATALVIGLDQIGIDVTFLTTLAAVLLGGLLLSIALAFGFGARELVSNLVAAQQLRGTLEPGEHARLGDAEGRVLEITPTMVVLVNDRGRHLVPASQMLRHTSTIISGDADE